MKAWRILRAAYAAEPLSGIGAARLGSRWNSVGVEMVYAATSRPLAVLEMLVHLTKEHLPLEAVLVPLEIPDESIDGLPEVPEGWNRYPYQPASQSIGDEWVRRSSSLAMLVPSVILPAERNILINPRHTQFNQIRVGEHEPHAFDRRLFGMK